MRRFAPVAAIAAAVLLVMGPAPAHAVGETVRIRTVDVSAFPDIKLTVAIGSDREAKLSDLHITENGIVVTPASIETLSTTGRSVDVVLALDTSSSVQGAPLVTAIEAAKRFLAQLPASIRAGLVTFADRATVAVPLTDDRTRLIAALDGLTTSDGTALFQGVQRAASIFSGPGQHNIIVLTDGADNRGSTVDDAIAAATDAGANVFTIGLASPALNVAILETLANATGGTYSPATQANLSTIYTQLGTELSHQYLVTYRTTAPAGSQLSVSVGAFGAEDTSIVLTPDAPASIPPPKADGQPLALRGTVGLAVVLGLSFLTAFLLMLMFLGARARNRRQQDLARRMLAEDRPRDALGIEDGKQVGVTWIPEPVAEVAQRIATAGGIAPGLEAKLERAGLPLSAGEFLAGTVGAALVGGILGQLLLQSLFFALLTAALAAFVPSIMLNVAIGRRSARLHSQLADVVSLLASSLRAGHSFFQALDIVSKEIGDPAGPEFQRVMVEVRLGRSVQDALDAMAERVGSEDFKWAVLAVNIQREVGGNLAEILDIVAETVRERDAIRRQVKVLTSEGRLSVKILVALPFVVALYSYRVNPTYMGLLFSTRLGWIFLATGGALMALGVVWARKVVKIDV